MPNRLTFEGLEELRAELRALPAELAAEAGEIVLEEGEKAKVEVIAAYEQHFKGDDGTGNLVKGVRVRRLNEGRFTAAALVQSTAPHAHLYEYGTAVRRHRSGKHVGRMPPAGVNGMVPVLMRARHRMWTRLKELVARKGLQVSGNP